MAKKKPRKKAAAKASKARKTTKRPAARRAKKGAGAAMDEAAQMAAWEKAATPGAGHRRLEPLAGSWKVRTTLTMTPGAPPQVSEGSSEHRFVLGGRYLEQRYKGSAMGMPFEGIGYTGYDNSRGKYVGTWMDSFGTGIMNSVGTGRPTDAKIDFDAEACDPTGGTSQFLCSVRIQDRDHNSYEMWTKAPNGKRFRAMLIEYTRR
jgi:hypothetical protein